MERDKPKKIESDYILFIEEYLSENQIMDQEDNIIDKIDFLGDYDYRKYLEEEEDE